MATAFDPATFWEEARRYGVTVASYTWTLLAELADAPPNPGERDHAIRLFIGSGMPSGLWRRIEQRFAPARVLEVTMMPAFAHPARPGRSGAFGEARFMFSSAMKPASEVTRAVIAPLPPSDWWTSS